MLDRQLAPPRPCAASARQGWSVPLSCAQSLTGKFTMFRISRIAAIAVAVSFAAGAYAADDKKDKSEGRICTLESVVGSHMPKRICTTAAEREASRQNAQEH